MEIAADLFLDVQLQSEFEQVEKDFHDLVAAANCVNRIPILGRKFERGLAGRRRLASLIRQRIPDWRANAGSDLMSQLCVAEDENGRRYDDDEIVDHLIFLMMAAHDTTTSALTTIVYALSKHTQWQAILHGHAKQLASASPAFSDLSRLECFDWSCASPCDSTHR